MLTTFFIGKTPDLLISAVRGAGPPAPGTADYPLITPRRVSGNNLTPENGPSWAALDEELHILHPGEAQNTWMPSRRPGRVVALIIFDD